MTTIEEIYAAAEKALTITTDVYWQDWADNLLTRRPVSHDLIAHLEEANLEVELLIVEAVRDMNAQYYGDAAYKAREAQSLIGIT